MSEPVPPREKHGVVGRALLVLVGSVIFVSFVALTVILLLSGREHAHQPRPSVMAIASVFFLALAGYGGSLALRGIRGSSALDGRMARLNARLARPLGITFLLGPLFGIAVLVLSHGLPPDLISDPTLRFCWFPGVALLLVVPSVAVHELGHWLAAHAMGLSVRILRIGPVVFTADKSGRRVSLDWGSVQSLLGLNQLDLAEAPPDRGRLCVFILGGPLANAIAAGLCSTVLGRVMHGSVVDRFVLVAAYVNGYLALTNMVPFGLQGGMMSDGKWLLSLLRPRTPGHYLLFRIQRLVLTARPRDWGLASEELLGAIDSSSVVKSELFLFAFCVAQDRGEKEHAEAILERALADPTLQPRVRYELQLQRAMCDALVHHDPTQARRSFEAVDRTLEQRRFYPGLAEAAVLHAEGKLQESTSSLTEWMKQVASTGSLARTFRAGNEWALDRLHGGPVTSQSSEG